jgi:LysR family hydrogen peroxide-inducible transcriptional activator
MNLKDLRYFVSVARLKHFRKASEECCISQPTLSAQIKKLEQALGVELFIRGNRTVSLTGIGEEVLLCAQNILEQENKIKDLAQTAKNPFLSTLKIGAFPTLAPYFFPKFITAIKNKYPQLKLVIVEEKSDVLTDMLLSRTLDFAFLALPIQHKELSTKLLFEDPFYLAVNKAHELANETNVSIQQIKNKEIVLLQDGHCLSDQVTNFCAIFHAKESVDYKASSLETLRQMVLANSGITLMPKIAICNTNEAIRYIPFTSKQIKRDIGLVYRHNPTKGILIDEFISIMSQFK